MDEPVNFYTVGAWVVGLLGTAFASLTAVWGHRIQKGNPEHDLIKLLQAQVAAGDERSNKQDERMGRIEKEHGEFKDEVKEAQRAADRRDRILTAYAIGLRRHIDTEQGPPAPDWPTELN